MKRTFLSLLLAAALVFPALAQDADRVIKITAGEMPLSALIAGIESQSNYLFVYNNKDVDAESRVKVTLSEGAITKILDDALNGTVLGYSIADRYITLSKKGKSDAAQVVPKSISGVVRDANGEPMVGATVVIKGTNTGVATDGGGNFAFTATENDVLVVSFMGYKPLQVPVGKRSEFALQMRQEATELEDVVVVGYGTQNKRDVSTSISSIKFDQLADAPVADFRSALVGKMAGVQVIQSSGEPEAGVSIRVRGISTITAGSEPLYVIDGVPMERGLTNINTNDIETIDVLKDASAAAIYGSRGSNGVVLITTKKGKSDKLTVQYDGYYGVQSVSKKIAMMDAYQFALAAKDGHDNAYLDLHPDASADDANALRPETFSQIPPELFPYLDGEAGLTNTDWQDAIFRTASTTSHNVSLSGKSDKVNYFASFGYMNKEGIVIGSDLEKYSARLNLDAAHKKLKFGINFSPSYSVSNRVDASGNNGIVKSALMMPPVWPVYNEDGTYNYQGNGYWRVGTDYQHNAVLNPVAQAMLQSDVVDRMALVGKTFAEYEFIKGLTYNISFGGDYYGSHNDTYRQSALPLLGQAYLDKPSNPTGYSSSGFYFNWLVENKLNYSTVIADKHSINATLLQSAQKETYKGNNVTATDYPNDYVQTISGGTVSKGASNITEWSIASYLARVQYAYEGRYLVSAAIRADGSSRFGANNRWGYFPSASAAWRVSDEGFFKNLSALSFVDDLKLKVSYGETGNFNIGNYDHIATMSKENYILGSGNGVETVGYKPDNVKHPELKWEKTAMVNTGFELQTLKGFAGLSVEYYNANTSDMLLTVPVPHLTGQSTSLLNIGSVNNHGWELMLTSQQKFANGLSYNFSANYAKNINKVTSLGPENAPLLPAGSVASAWYITEVGKPIGNYYLLVQDGIFATADELTKYPHIANTHVGDRRFVDVDGDGELSVDKDRTIVGNYMPDFTYGFSGSVAYKGVDFSFNLQGVYGNEILNLQQYHINNQEGNTNGTLEGFLNHWRSEAEPGNGTTPRINRKQTGNNQTISTWHIEDGSYFRLQNISLGYTLPQKLTQKFSVEKLRIYVSGQNLWTLTGYTGYNPEVSARPDNSTTPGEDYGTYPLAKVFTMGLNITF